MSLNFTFAEATAILNGSYPGMDAPKNVFVDWAATGQFSVNDLKVLVANTTGKVIQIDGVPVTPSFHAVEIRRGEI